MAGSPLDVLRVAEAERVAERLAALEPLDADAVSVVAAEEALVEARRAYAGSWKRVTGGKSPLWSEGELVSAGYERPVSVSRARSKSKKSPAPAESARSAGGDVVVPDGQEDGLPG